MSLVMKLHFITLTSRGWPKTGLSVTLIDGYKYVYLILVCLLTVFTRFNRSMLGSDIDNMLSTAYIFNLILFIYSHTYEYLQHP